MEKLVNLDTWVEHIVHIDGVTGSSPVATTTKPRRHKAFEVLCVYTDIVILCGPLPRGRTGGSFFGFLNRRERFEPPSEEAAHMN